MPKIPERVVKTLTSNNSRKKLFNLKFEVDGTKYQVRGLGSTALKLGIPSPTPNQDSFSFLNWDKIGTEEEKIVQFLLDYISSP